MSTKPTKDEVMKANIALHTALADVYNKEEPHWRPENVAKVEAKLKAFKTQTNGTKLLDLGCGSGFIINIAKKLEFKEIHGFDITKAMTDQIDRNYDKGVVNITLKDTAQVDSPDNFFDIVTAYTFLSHLDDLEPTLRQAYRCLKPGGIIYSDLDPNAAFWEELYNLEEGRTYHPFIQREIIHTKNIDRVLKEKYNISPEIYNVAEYQKTQSHGIKEDKLVEVLSNIGFKDIEVKYEWFVGQGMINNDPSLSPEARSLQIGIIEEYLKGMNPLSRNLFKYISFTAKK